ncbi:hypothetical protein [Aliiroseovarius sp. F20344]|uniref:hypothetical protein n=1 Tax=Aliiroseovarius sp. F20344 TaxID=2926414 RepID=UPI001FF48212|nr:hypothetical protein [Aliiroseovarius sp. F20344]MCK0141502.1 hypothetical protein [Aliiroseovarius sp. F20344]
MQALHKGTPTGGALSLDETLLAAMQSVPNCLAAGYIDMQTGFLLGLQGQDQDSMDALETLSTSVANLILGQGVRTFEELLSDDKDASSTGFGEIAIYSGGRLYVLLRREDQPDHLICFVSDGDTNVGLALAKSAANLNAISASV